MTGSSLTAETPYSINGDSATRLDWRNWIEREPEIQVPESSATNRGGRVLLISYMFPPIGGSAVQRPAKLAKYLPSFGWSVEVLSADHDRFAWHDASLLQDMPADCRIHRVPGFEPACMARRVYSLFGSRLATRHRSSTETKGRRPSLQRIEDAVYWRLAKLTGWLGMGNGETLWIGPAVRASLCRHRDNPFDAVISTGPPHFVHHVAMRMARAAEIPWVADVRDPLVVDDYYRTPMSRRWREAMRHLEQTILQQASAVVTTCPSLAEVLRSRYDRRSPEDIYTITNGFDREDVRAALTSHDAGVVKNQDCVFVAAGAWYGRRELRKIVEPMQRVLDRHPLWRHRVRLVVAGTIDAEQRKTWEQQHPEWMTLLGYVDHASALQLVAEAACAMVVVPRCRTGYQTVPGKVFELLALPTHVLALVPPGSDTERIARNAGASTVAPLEEVDAVESAMEQIIHGYFDGELSAERDWTAINTYDRCQVAATFAGCLASVSAKRVRR